MTELNNIISIITPVLIILFKDQPLIIVGLPIVLLLSDLAKSAYQYIIDNYNSWSNHSLIKIPSLNEYEDINQAHIRLLWFLTQNNIEIKNLSCIGTIPIKYSDKGSKYDKFDPKYSSSQCSKKIKFMYDGMEYFVEFVEEEGHEKKHKLRYIYIYSKNVKDIQKLIKTSFDEYRSYRIGVKKRTYCYYSYNDGWSSKKIRTIKTRSNIFLKNEIIDNVYKNIDTFLEFKKIYLDRGIPYKKGFMFYGIPGTGKTSLIYAIANDYNRNIYSVKLNNFNDDEKFKHAISSIPSGDILVIEDIDNMNVSKKRELKIKKKNKDDDDNKSSVMIDSWSSLSLDSLLEVLDGYNYLHDTIIIFTTNHLYRIDPALLRPGRIDETYEFSYADFDTCCEIMFDYYPQNFNIDDIEFLRNSKITSAKLINTIIMPNYDDYCSCLKSLIFWSEQND